MGIERRGNRHYYYQKERYGTTIRSVYVGSGLLAQYASIIDQDKREKDRAARVRRDAQIEIDRRADNEVIGLMASAKVITDAFMVAMGYRQSKRVWRRNKMVDTEEISTEVKTQKDYSAAELNALIERVNHEKPEQKDIEELRAYFKYAPQLVTKILGIAANVRRNQLNSISKHKSMQLAVEFETEEMCEGLGYEDATLIERVHIQVIIAAWLRLKKLELMLEIQESNDWGVHYEKRVSAAQGRFLRASESLARVRRAMHGLPMIGQLNVAMPGSLQQNNAEAKS